MDILYPENNHGDITYLLNRLRLSRYCVTPFSEEVISFLDSLSKDLFSKSRAFPGLAPLAFFIRRSNTLKIKNEFVSRLPLGSVSTPQGIVFHIPPTNVDSLFLYTLALSLLCGNSNVVRISRNAGQETEFLLETIIKTLAQHKQVSDLVTFISFDRDQAVLDSISELSDVRMVWGGDSTVNAIRSSPLGVHGKELAFPDRMSLTAINCDFWNSMKVTEKTSIVEKLYNDTFWFDQMACSSPQQIVFVSENRQLSFDVEQELSSLLDLYAQNRYLDTDGQAINKMVAIVKAIGLGATRANWKSNSLVTVEGLNLNSTEKIRPGGGYFSTQTVSSLMQISEQINRKIQTLSYLGFTPQELENFVKGLNGRGIDRIVPIGQALDFNEIWDGKQLLMEMQRLVTIR